MQQHSSKCWHAGTTTVMQPGSSRLKWHNRRYMQQLLLAVLLLGYLACGLSQPVAAAAAAVARSGQQQQQQRGIGSYTTACTADGSLSQQVGAMVASSISRDALLSVTAVRLLGPCSTLGFVTLPVTVKAPSLQQQQQLVTLVSLSSSSELLVRDLQAANVLTQEAPAAASGSADASIAAALTSRSSSKGASRQLAAVELQINVTVAADAPFFADLVLRCVTRCPKLLAESAAPELWIEHTGAWAGEQKTNVLWEALRQSNSSNSSSSSSEAGGSESGSSSSSREAGGSEPGSSSSSSSDSSRAGRVLPGPVVPGFSKVRLLMWRLKGHYLWYAAVFVVSAAAVQGCHAR
jgi:hypothetical protein